MKIATGDIFLVGLGDTRSAVGQIVGSTPPSRSVWVAIFWPPLDHAQIDERVPVLIATPPVLLTQTLDLFLKNGRWRRHSTAEVIAAIRWPAFKVATGPGVFQVTDHQGAVYRLASSEEIETLPYSSSFSPAAVEHATEALAGLGEWDEFFNPMRPGANTEDSVLER